MLDTEITIHHESFSDPTISLWVENCLDEIWASQGVDYEWIGDETIKIRVPKEVSYADVAEDIMLAVLEFFDDKTLIPKSLIDRFSLSAENLLTR